MKIETIIDRLRAKGYNITRTWTGNILVTNASTGRYRIFKSYAEAARNIL